MTETTTRPSSTSCQDFDDRRLVSEVRRVTLIGLVINVALSALKLAAGIAGNSQAVVADAVHSLSDTVTDVAVLVGSSSGRSLRTSAIPTVTGGSSFW